MYEATHATLRATALCAPGPATALVLGSLAATAQAQQADPLAGIQWHLLNTGQTVPADTGRWPATT